MSDTLSASIFVFHPQRVTVDELAALRAADARAAAAQAQAADAQAAAAPSEAPSVLAPQKTPLPPPPVLPQSSPACCNPDCPHRRDANILRQQAGYWQAQHQRALARLRQLQDQVDHLEALLRQREQQLFGRKSEASSSATPLPTLPSQASPTSESSGPAKRRPRGQQPNSKGHQRRDYSHLPATDEVLDLPEDQRKCSSCGLSFAPFPGTEDTTVLEIEVRAYRRRSHRPRYRPTCKCGCHPGIVTAPPPPRLIPRSILGVSIWTTVLLDKFEFYRPTHRLLADLRTHGLDLSQGTLTDGLQRLKPLFDPLYQKLLDRQQQQQHWHGDETRWLMFVRHEGKVGHRWYLWNFCSVDVVAFVLSPGRDHEVPEKHLGKDAKGILNVDRYSAYKAMAQVKAGKIILAFCWAHVRRDFLEVARGWPKQEEWVLLWINRIGELYRRNKERLAVKDDPVPSSAADQAVRAQVAEMARKLDEELIQVPLHPACRKVLESLREHWSGLTVFVENPHVPMDNNRAERAERGPVVARKNFWGSAAKWSGELAASLFSLFGTLELNQINPRLWLTAYLNACAAAGGKPPGNLDEWLPWNLSEQRRREWSSKPEAVNSS
jgi:transposase